MDSIQVKCKNKFIKTCLCEIYAQMFVLKGHEPEVVNLMKWLKRKDWTPCHRNIKNYHFLNFRLFIS